MARECELVHFFLGLEWNILKAFHEDKLSGVCAARTFEFSNIALEQSDTDFEATGN